MRNKGSDGDRGSLPRRVEGKEPRHFERALRTQRHVVESIINTRRDSAILPKIYTVPESVRDVRYVYAGSAIFLLVFTFLTSLIIMTTDQMTPGYMDAGGAISRGAFFVVEDSLFFLLLQYIAPTQMGSSRMTAWIYGLLLAEGIFKFFSHWDATESTEEVRMFATVMLAMSYGISHIGLPVYSFYKAGKIKAKSFVFWLGIVPVAGLTFIAILLYPYRPREYRAISLLIGIYGLFINVILLAVLVPWAKTDGFGYVLLVAGTSHSGRILAHVLMYLFQALKAAKYRAAITCLLARAIFFIATVCIGEQLDALKYNRFTSNSSMIFNLQFGEDFLISGLFVTVKISSEMAALLVMTVALGLIRDCGIFQEWYSRRIKRNDTPEKMAKYMKKVFVNAQQNAISESLASPLLFVMVLGEYLGRVRGVGKPILTRNISTDNIIRETLWVFMLTIPLNWIQCYVGYILLRRRMDRLNKAVVKLEMDDLQWQCADSSKSSFELLSAEAKTGRGGKKADGERIPDEIPEDDDDDEHDDENEKTSSNARDSKATARGNTPASIRAAAEEKDGNKSLRSANVSHTPRKSWKDVSPGSLIRTTSALQMSLAQYTTHQDSHDHFRSNAIVIVLSAVVTVCFVRHWVLTE